MKTFCFFAAASLLCATASAAAPHGKCAIATPARIDASMLVKSSINPVKGNLVEANHDIRGPRKAAPSQGQAYYYRPAGAMFGCFTTADYVVSTPYLMVKPFAGTTFVAQDAASPAWQVQHFNRETSRCDWFALEGSSVNVVYGYETDSVPVLNAGGSQYHLFGFNSDDTRSHGTVAAVKDVFGWTYSDFMGGVVSSPKFFGGNRDDVSDSPLTLYGGAPDSAGGTTANWFGHNSGEWNGMAVYAEAPENPYLLRSLWIRYTELELANDATIYADVYKVTRHAAIGDQDAVNDLELGVKIASGSYTFIKNDNPDYSGFVQVNLVGQGDGLAPTVDDAIAVVVRGYDSPGFNNFSLLISSDKWDEGHGQHGYMLKVAQDGAVANSIGLDHFFTFSLGVTAPSVFFDVVNPFLAFNYDEENGVRDFDPSGNCTTTVPAGFNHANNQLSLFSAASGADMTFTLEDGSNLPQWLTIETTDGNFDQTGGNVTLTVTCAAGAVEDRHAVVKISIPGAYTTIEVNQTGTGVIPPVSLLGDVNNDGVVDIVDVNILIGIVLGSDSADNYGGRADVNNDGIVDIIDINILVGIVLGM